MTAIYTSIGILVLYLQLISGLQQLLDSKGLPSNQRIKAAGPLFVAPAPISTSVIAAVASMLPYKLPNNDQESESNCAAFHRRHKAQHQKSHKNSSGKLRKDSRIDFTQ